MSADPKTEALARLGRAQKVAVISHIRPDCDTLGAGLGLRLALESLGKEVVHCCSDPVPERYLFLSGLREVRAALPENFDLLVSVDCSDHLRMGAFGEAFLKAPNTLNIDHHRSNLKEGKVNVVEDASSCSEIVFDLIGAMGVKLTYDMALPLYFGLASDTGNFTHSNTTARSFATAAVLKEILGDVSDYVYLLFKENPLPRFRLLANTLSGAKFFAEDRLCVLSVCRADLERFGADSSMTEGFVDYAVNCAPAYVGVSILEAADKQNVYKISFRSKGKVDVCELCESFGGGGHTRAAGCVICGRYEDVLDKVVKAVTDRLPF